MPSPLSTVALIAGAVVIGTAATAVGVATVLPQPQETVVVTKIVDGDTIDVRQGGEVTRVRLMNIDAPESVDPNRPVECLGQDASRHLASILPVDSTVRLEYDDEREDRYGRDIAGVFLDDTLINAEVVRAGLAVPLLIEPNDRFYAEVSAAFADARDAKAGFFDPSAECTLPSRTDRYEEAAAAFSSAPTDAAAADLEQQLAEADTLLAEGELLLTALAAESLGVQAGGLPRTELDRLRTRADAAVDRVTSWQSQARAVQEERAAEEERQRQQAEEQAEAERKAKEAEERARQEAEERARQEEESRKAAEEQARREAEDQRREAEEAARRSPAPAPAPAPLPAPAPAPAPPSPPSSGGGDRPGAGYTGCRAYVGGPYIDDQGRRYTPIDCQTRLPLVP